MGQVSNENDNVFIASLPGNNVFMADPEDCSIHSGFDYPKMEEDLVGTVDYTVPAYTSDQTYTIATVTHGFGYMPLSQCFVEDLDGALVTEFATLPLNDGVTASRFVCYTTTTQFILQYIAVDGGIFGSPQWDGMDFKFKYQVWVND